MRHLLAMPVTMVVTLGLALTAWAAETLGHKDFHPSPARPVGWRGDGTGVYPGAAGVPLDWDLATGSNVLWKDTLGYSLSAPVVFGGKVFTAEEPDGVVCLDAATGKQLWKQNMGADPVVIKELKANGLRNYYRFTTSTPISDGRHVVFRSGAGKLGCF
jgi:hypothetical protein